MAPAAVDSLLRYFGESGTKPQDYDLIVSGDLGYEGHGIVTDLLASKSYVCAGFTMTAGFSFTTGGGRICTPAVGLRMQRQRPCRIYPAGDAGGKLQKRALYGNRRSDESLQRAAGREHSGDRPYRASEGDVKAKKIEKYGERTEK